MANVNYDQGVPQVSPDARMPDDYQHLRADPDSFGGAIARGGEKLGAGITQFVDHYGQVAKDEGMNQIRDMQNKLLYGDPKLGPDGKPQVDANGAPVMDGGYLRETGANALTQRAVVAKSFDDMVDQVRKNLRSRGVAGEALNAFETQVSSLKDRFGSSVGQHADQQFKVYTTGVNASTLAQATSGIATGVATDNPKLVASSSELFLGAKIKEAQLKFGNLTPDMMRQVVADAKRDSSTTYVEALGVKNPTAAADFVEKNKDAFGAGYGALVEKFRNAATAQTGVNVFREEVARTTQPATQPGQVPAPVREFLQARSKARMDGLNPVFATGLQGAIAEAEAATGQRAQVNSMVRSREQQAELYARYQAGTGGLAAAPGTSRHERGLAADIQDGPVLRWMHEHRDELEKKYGVEFLKGRAFEVDSGHLQFKGPAQAYSMPGTPAGQRGGFTLSGPGAVSSAPAYTVPAIANAPVEVGGVQLAALSEPPAPTTPAPPKAPEPDLEAAKAAAIKRVLEDPKIDDLRKPAAVNAINQQFAMAQASMAAQTTAKAKEQEALSDAYSKKIMTANMRGDAAAISGVQSEIVNDARLEPSARTTLWNLSRQSLSDPAHQNGYGESYNAFLKRVANGEVPTLTELTHAMIAPEVDGVKRAPPLTMAGYDALKKMLAASAPGEAPKINALATRQTSALTMAENLTYTNPMLDLPMRKRLDPEGQAAFAKVQNLLLDEIGSLKTEAEQRAYFAKIEENVRRVVDMVRPAAARQQAQVSGTPVAQDKVTVPPPPGIPVEIWTQVASRPPVLTKPDGAQVQMPVGQWASALDMLARNPSPEMVAKFDKAFGASGVTGSGVLQMLTGRRPAAAEAPNAAATPAGPPASLVGAPLPSAITAPEETHEALNLRERREIAAVRRENIEREIRGETKLPVPELTPAPPISEAEKTKRAEALGGPRRMVEQGLAAEPGRRAKLDDERRARERAEYEALQKALPAERARAEKMPKGAARDSAFAALARKDKWIASQLAGEKAGEPVDLSPAALRSWEALGASAQDWVNDHIGAPDEIIERIKSSKTAPTADSAVGKAIIKYQMERKARMESGGGK